MEIRRKIRVVTTGLTLLCVLLLAACGSPTSKPEQQPAAPSNQTDKAPAANSLAGTTIRLGVVANYKGDALEKAVPEFEKKTGIKVQIDKLPHNNLADKLAISFASGNPDYDVAMADEPWIPGLAPFLIDVDQYVKRDKIDLNQYVANALAAGVIEGKRVAMPLDPNVMMLWYRKDLFAAKNIQPPKTWDEIEAAAQKLHDPNNGVYGISLVGKKDVQASVAAIVFLWNEGADIIMPDGSFGFDSPAGIKAFERYQRLLKLSAPGVLGYGPTEALDAFYTGKSAMVFYWASIGPNATNPEKSKVADKVGWVAIPNGMRGVWNLVVPEKSKNKDAAWELVKWLTDKEGSTLWTKYGGGHTARLDVLNSEEFKKTYPWAPELVQALNVARNRPQHKNWNAIETSIVDMTTAIISGQKQAGDAIKAAGAQIAPYLKK